MCMYVHIQMALSLSLSLYKYHYDYSFSWKNSRELHNHAKNKINKKFCSHAMLKKCI